MHKTFYASGFLFNPSTQQILLQQTLSTEKVSLFSGTGSADESPEAAFQRVILERLNVEINPRDIHPIYNYQNAENNRNHYVFYAELRTKIEEHTFDEDLSAVWFNFKKLYKTKLSKELLQDLVVGQRVINASLRANL